MILYLVRHGETNRNHCGILQGHCNSRLNERGLNQARLIAKRLKRVNFDAIYASDLTRARRTAQEIAVHQKCGIKYSKDIRERNFGVFCSKTVEEFYDHLAKKKALKNPFYKLPKGESYHQFQLRVVNYVNSIYQDNYNKTILISTHGGVKNALFRYFFNKHLKLDNTSLTILKFDKFCAQPIIMLENCSKHLKDIESLI